MTVGSSGDFTWRYRLWQHLRATAGPSSFHLVGPRTALYDKAADAAVSQHYGDPSFPADARRHLAGWGEGWLHMAPVIRDAVTLHRPDLLLVFLGLIDLGFYTGPADTEANLRRFVAQARAADPSLRMVFLPVLPNSRARTDPPFQEQVTDLNARMRDAVSALTTPASPLLLAQPPDPWHLPTDTYDGTHPTPRGEHRIAAAFATVLHTAWGVGGEYLVPAR